MCERGSSGEESDPGDASFASFYRTEHRQLIRFVRSLGASWDEAWDIGQECFVEALTHWDTLSVPHRWIRTVAVRLRQRTRARAADELPRLLKGCWQPRPYFDELDFHPDEAHVYKVIASLPPRQAEVFALTYDGYTPKEIAEILSEVYPAEDCITTDAVRASLYQARDKLRRRLNGNWEV